MGDLNQKYILKEAKEISNKLYQETIDFLEENYELLREMSDLLIKKETLDEEEVDALIVKHTSNKETQNNIIIPSFTDEDGESQEKKRRGLSQFRPDNLIPDIVISETLAK